MKVVLVDNCFKTDPIYQAIVGAGLLGETLQVSSTAAP